MASYNIFFKSSWLHQYNISVDWKMNIFLIDRYKYVNIFSLKSNIIFRLDEEKVLYYTHQI